MFSGKVIQRVCLWLFLYCMIVGCPIIYGLPTHNNSGGLGAPTERLEISKQQRPNTTDFLVQSIFNTNEICKQGFELYAGHCRRAA